MVRATVALIDEGSPSMILSSIDLDWPIGGTFTQLSAEEHLQRRTIDLGLRITLMPWHQLHVDAKRMLEAK